MTTASKIKHEFNRGVQSVQEAQMAESDKVFAGSIPKIDDAGMIPLIFEAYAGDLAELVVASSPGSVLEIVAGSGVLAWALDHLISPGSTLPPPQSTELSDHALYAQEGWGLT